MVLTIPVTGSIVSSLNAVLPGITVHLLGDGGFAGVDFQNVTDTGGKFSFAVPSGWTGRVIPYSDTYLFSPGLIAAGPAMYNVYTGVITPISGLNFVATATVEYIKVVRSVISPAPPASQPYVLEVNITEARGVEAELFVHHVKTVNPMLGGSPVRSFSHICSPVDVQEIPVGSEDVFSGAHTFRTSGCKIQLYDMAQVQEAWNDIRKDLEEFGRTLKDIKVLTLQPSAVVLVSPYKYLTLTTRISGGYRGRTQAWRLMVDVTGTDGGIAAEIFLYRRRAFLTSINSFADFFERVCLPHELTVYPAVSESVNDGQPYFRSRSVDLLFRSPEQRDEAWAYLLKDVQELGATYVELSGLAATATEVITF